MRSLPPSWTQNKVGELFYSFSGGTPSKSRPEYWNGSIPWISSGEFNSDVITEGTEFISKLGLENSSAKLCRPGSVIVVVRSGILKHTLPVALVGKELAINQDIKCFDSGNDDLNRWLFFSLANSSRQILSLNREGTTVQSVKYDTLKEHELAIPPLNEQGRIVAKLEELLSRVNAAQDRLAIIPHIFKRFRQSVLNAAYTGLLIEDLENGNGKWNKVTLGEVTRELVTGPFGSSLHKSDYVIDGIPVINPTNLLNGKIVPSPTMSVDELTKRRLSRYILKYNDIVVARRGELGRCALVSKTEAGWLCGTGAAILRPNKTALPEYIQFVLSSPAGRSYLTERAVGSTMANLNQRVFLAMPLLLPSLVEQREIVRRVNALFKTAEALEVRYGKAKTHVDKLSQSILGKAFRGELVPQDPNDEPASTLIERIRHQRNGTR